MKAYIRVYKMLRAVGPLMPGDAVLAEGSIHCGLVRLATPQRPHWHIGPLPGETSFKGPFLSSPYNDKWIENGIALEMTEEELEIYKPHFTKRIWLLGTREAFELRRNLWLEHREGRPKRRVVAGRFVWPS